MTSTLFWGLADQLNWDIARLKLVYNTIYQIINNLKPPNKLGLDVSYILNLINDELLDDPKTAYVYRNWFVRERLIYSPRVNSGNRIVVEQHLIAYIEIINDLLLGALSKLSNRSKCDIRKEFPGRTIFQYQADTLP